MVHPNLGHLQLKLNKKCTVSPVDDDLDDGTTDCQVVI